MKFTTLVVIFSLFISSIYAASELPVSAASSDLPIASLPAPKTTPSVPSPELTTEANPATAPTEPTTTTTTTTATTSSTTTSTEASTTAKTTVTTPATSTTTPSPSPPAPKSPEIRNWTLTDANRTCILLEFATQLNVSYTNNDNKTVYFTYNLPKDAKSSASGSCGNGTNEQNISIEWTDANSPNTMNLTFRLNGTAYSLSEAIFNLNAAIFPNANNANLKFYHVGNAFETYKGRSYHCTRVQTLNLTQSEGSIDVVGTVSLSHTSLEAFHDSQNKQFSQAIDCDAINTPDIVPIAVGIALIALVVVVLIAYLVGRRRSQARGYVSM